LLGRLEAIELDELGDFGQGKPDRHPSERAIGLPTRRGLARQEVAVPKATDLYLLQVASAELARHAFLMRIDHHDLIAEVVLGGRAGCTLAVPRPAGSDEDQRDNKRDEDGPSEPMHRSPLLKRALEHPE